jgi:hypothetical protein
MQKKEKERKSIFPKRFLLVSEHCWISNLLQHSEFEFKINLIFQSPRNGEDLSDGEQENETGIRESSPEGSVTGQVRVKVSFLKLFKKYLKTYLLI